MLYLIKSGNYLKIGFARDINQRMRGYRTDNPDFELLDVMEGDTEKESYLHTLCQKYHHRNEWFIYNKEIIDIFSEEKQVNDIASIEDYINDEPSVEEDSPDDLYQNLLAQYKITTKKYNKLKQNYKAYDKNLQQVKNINTLQDVKIHDLEFKIQQMKTTLEEYSSTIKKQSSTIEDAIEVARYFKNLVKREHPEDFNK